MMLQFDVEFPIGVHDCSGLIQPVMGHADRGPFY